MTQSSAYAGTNVIPRSRRRWLELILSFATTAALSLALWVTPAAGASACSGARTNLFAGRFGYSVTTFGSSGSINTVNPSLCSGGSTFSTNWTMLAPQATNAWAQSGYLKDTLKSATAIYYFAQWRQNGTSTPATVYLSGPSAGSIHQYRTTVNPSGYLEMYSDTTKLAQSTWKPSLNWGAQPWSNQFSGETGHCQTDLPGYDFNKGHYTAVTYQAQQSGPWLNSVGLGTFHDCGSTYQVLTSSSTVFDIWTNVP